MSVLVCAGKLTYPIKFSSDKMGLSGVSYVERLTDYLKYNSHINKVIFVETIDNVFEEGDIEGFDGAIKVISNLSGKYDKDSEEGTALSEETLRKIVSIKELEGLRVSDIQWEIMNS